MTKPPADGPTTSGEPAVGVAQATEHPHAPPAPNGQNTQRAPRTSEGQATGRLTGASSHANLNTGAVNAGTLAFVALLGLVWGLNWPAIKVLLREIEPFTIRASALCAAGLLLGTLAAARGDRLVPPLTEIPWMLVTGLLTIFGFNVLVVIGQTLTEASTAAIIAYVMPALTVLLSCVLLGERLRLRQAAALAIAMAGLAILAMADVARLIADPRGALVMVAAAFVWALGTVAMKAGRFALPPLALTAWFLLMSGLASLPLVVMFEAPFERPLPSAAVFAVWAWHVVCPMVLGYALWTLLVARLPASIAAIATLLAPVVGVASSIALLGEAATVGKISALALIVVSIALVFAPRGRPTSNGSP
ncbi:MAG: DMT family transporter [Pseudomonadota bacterium]